VFCQGTLVCSGPSEDSSACYFSSRVSTSFYFFYPFSFIHVFSIPSTPTDPFEDGVDFDSAMVAQPAQNAGLSFVAKTTYTTGFFVAQITAYRHMDNGEAVYETFSIIHSAMRVSHQLCSSPYEPRSERHKHMVELGNKYAGRDRVVKID
jgi:hypothetical protein